MTTSLTGNGFTFNFGDIVERSELAARVGEKRVGRVSEPVKEKAVRAGAAETADASPARETATNPAGEQR